jgi:signal transduction histidine kinase
VTISIQRERVVAKIKDDGEGFDLNAPPAAGRHLGLLGMKERAEALGGTFEIRSQAGTGTEIHVEFTPEAPRPSR